MIVHLAKNLLINIKRAARSRSYPSSKKTAGAAQVKYGHRLTHVAALLTICLLTVDALADNPTYYAQWGAAGDPVPKVCIHYTTPSGINPWSEGSIQYPTRVDGAIGTPN